MSNLELLSSFIRETYGFEGQISVMSGGLNNDNFVISGDTGRFTIKWYYPDTPGERLDLEREALLLLDGGSRIGAPRFVPARDGNLRTTLSGRTVSCFTFLAGAPKYSLIDAPRESEVVSSMGRALGLIHTDLNRWTTLGEQLFLKRKPAPSRRLVEFAEQGAGLCSARIPHDILHSSLRAIESGFALLTEEKQPFIRIHGDFQPGNLFFDGPDVVEICDFEYSSWEFRLFDLAMAVSILISGSSSHGTDGERIVRDFTRSYDSTALCPITTIEKRVFGPALVLSYLLNLSWAIPRLEDPSHGETVRQFYDQTCAVYLRDCERLLTDQPTSFDLVANA